MRTLITVQVDKSHGELRNWARVRKVTLDDTNRILTRKYLSPAGKWLPMNPDSTFPEDSKLEFQIRDIGDAT